MKPYVFLLISVLALLGIILAAALFQPIEGLTGINHPEFPNMKVAPDTVGMHGHTKWMSFGIAMFLIALFVMVLYIGSLRKSKVTGLAKWIYVFGIAYSCLFALTIFSNWNYISSTENTFWGQMPRPTAWMIYALWLCPMIVVIGYVIGFEKWVISSEEEKELMEWLNENRA